MKRMFNTTDYQGSPDLHSELLPHTLECLSSKHAKNKCGSECGGKGALDSGEGDGYKLILLLCGTTRVL